MFYAECQQVTRSIELGPATGIVRRAKGARAAAESHSETVARGIAEAIFSWYTGSVLSSAQRRLLGRWLLIGWRAWDDGVALAPERARGALVYCEDGWMAVQISYDDRSAEDATRYLAYCARWRLDGDEVSHAVDMCVNPAWQGSLQVRRVSWDGEELLLRTPELAWNGRRRVAELRWRRASAAVGSSGSAY
jgi:hypothetical protein